MSGWAKIGLPAEKNRCHGGFTSLPKFLISAGPSRVTAAELIEIAQYGDSQGCDLD